MTKQKKHAIWITCAILVVLLFAGLHYWHIHERQPIANPHPKYFVTIKGNIQPHMPYPMTVMFRASYAAYNPKCAVQGSWFNLSGLDYMPGKPVYYPAKPNAQGDYVIKIPIDAYKPGKCDWKIAWVMYSFVKKIPFRFNWSRTPSWGDMIRFGKKGDPQELPLFPASMRANVFCGSDGRVNCSGTELGGWYVKSVLRSKSYLFIQNIKSKKGEKR
jgi:hypothetical protein